MGTIQFFSYCADIWLKPWRIFPEPLCEEALWIITDYKKLPILGYDDMTTAIPSFICWMTWIAAFMRDALVIAFMKEVYHR
ncbi:MAG: hypothetical protein A2029_11645 [Chloroflexi bacterium RBG_19FT_COMBO_47_9]|nr:MAG: hypothetical protein A2029_11645 [Chloroflexi bacterium RBG_19FT_COMBO_47_9]